ncbi:MULTISPECIES: DMT family transporter [Bifidobacterium]|jgi:drug/metabolite transporter (DMT)-like permease|uniref:DMT family transporter n=1 Tax=Bifidobacterium tibiigranuli TaxID=2172043 RepID=A0A5N6S1A9_9BIFI|nr:DMT family transporter [Bifidobacterium tibiigranuli]KAE8128477.1 DMT family transporter [Bifidobacterium tibiigranuli]KAE8128506.1 EamA/RhaT family transporter [Bifidobacterium tibiigranuli]MCI1210689.1 DMT family transporter [Bifidobacterium tibiigranuli]
MSSTDKERALLVLVTVVWGVNFVSARFGLESMTPWGFRAVTFGAGALILVALASILHISLRLPRRIDYLHLLVAGTFSIALFGVLTAVSLLHTSVGQTSIVVYTMPIWVALLSSVFLGERLGARRWAAVGIGIVGLAVLMLPVIEQGFSLGAFAALGSALSWAVGTVYLKWACVAAKPLAITAWQLLAGTAISILALGLTGWHILVAPMTPASWGGVIYNTLAGTVLAYLIWFQVVQRLPASIAGLGTLLVPVFSMIAGVVLVRERPGFFDLAGFAAILVASVLALGGESNSKEE